MRRRALWITGLCVVAQALGVLALYGDDRKAPEKPFGLSKRVPWTTSRIVGSPDPPPPYRLKRVFPRLKFQSPVCIAQEPETEPAAGGRERREDLQPSPWTDPDADKPELFLDMKRPLYAFSFHPEVQGERPGLRLQPRPPPRARRARR